MTEQRPEDRAPEPALYVFGPFAPDPPPRAPATAVPDLASAAGLVGASAPSTWVPPSIVVWPAPYGLPPAAPARRSNRPLVAALVVISAVVLVMAGVLATVATRAPAVPPAPAAYRNGAYQPPPVDEQPPDAPAPRSFAEAERWTTASPLYAQHLAEPIRCDADRLPKAVRLVDHDLHDHLDDVTGCLMTVWHTPVEAASDQLYRPSITIFDRDIDVPGCGETEINAFFCPADQQIYWSSALLPTLAADEPRLRSADSIALDYVQAHEFGHDVQERVGIGQAAAALQQRAGRSTAAGHEVSRRLELQADCFSGMYLRAVGQSVGMTQDDVTTVDEMLQAVADPRRGGDHGRASARTHWWTVGYGTDDVGACNTFVAPADQVA